MSKTVCLAALLVILPFTANASPKEMNIALTAQESAAYSNMSGEQRYVLLQAVMKRGCPVDPPESMDKQDAIAQLNRLAPLMFVLPRMRSDCQKAVAAQAANHPTAIRVMVKRH